MPCSRPPPSAWHPHPPCASGGCRRIGRPPPTPRQTPATVRTPGLGPPGAPPLAHTPHLRSPPGAPRLPKPPETPSRGSRHSNFTSSASRAKDFMAAERPWSCIFAIFSAGCSLERRAKRRRRGAERLFHEQLQGVLLRAHQGGAEEVQRGDILGHLEVAQREERADRDGLTICRHCILI